MGEEKNLIIGVIGLGIVGGACKFGFQKLGHAVLGHDIKLNTQIEDVIKAEIIFVCVPTPPTSTGSCDISIVEDVIAKLIKCNYGGIIAIRSTIEPGTTEKLVKLHRREINFIPDFIRERCSVADFVENNNLLAIGTNNTDSFEKIKKCFGSYPKHCVMLTPTEAELLKYYHNTFSALRVVFANEFYEICQKMKTNYTNIKNALLYSSKLPDIYLDVSDNMRGYSSICWNKDVPAICRLAQQLDLDLPLMFMIEPANDKFKKTPFEGTREN